MQKQLSTRWDLFYKLFNAFDSSSCVAIVWLLDAANSSLQTFQMHLKREASQLIFVVKIRPHTILDDAIDRYFFFALKIELISHFVHHFIWMSILIMWRHSIRCGLLCSTSIIYEHLFEHITNIHKQIVQHFLCNF